MADTETKPKASPPKAGKLRESASGVAAKTAKAAKKTTAAKAVKKSAVKPVTKASPPKAGKLRESASGVAAKAAKPEEETRPRLRIKIRAYDHKIIDTAARQIVDAALRQSAEVLGPVPLPTEFRRYTVNKSTFVHKDARDQFEMRVHRRLIDIPSPTPKLIDALMALTLPAGVDTEIKTL